MAWTDGSPADVRAHVTAVRAPVDLVDFWAETLGEARAVAAAPTLAPTDSPLQHVAVEDLRFSGWGGQRVAGWYARPAHVEADLPCLVQFIGYGGSRGLPHEWTTWPAIGWSTVVMDTRGQGSNWGGGDTPDHGATGDPSAPGFVTQGILDRLSYYYRRLFTDAALLVDSVRALPGVDPSRVAVAGGSQGGAIAIATAALSEGLLACLPELPFLCDVMAATTKVDTAPYSEIAQYLRARPVDEPVVRRTLSYHDGAILAAMATCPALFTVGFMDDVCPPSSVYAAYNAWNGPKRILEFPYSRHEENPTVLVEQAAFLAELLTGRS